MSQMHFMAARSPKVMSSNVGISARRIVGAAFLR